MSKKTKILRWLSMGLVSIDIDLLILQGANPYQIIWLHWATTACISICLLGIVWFSFMGAWHSGQIDMMDDISKHARSQTYV